MLPDGSTTQATGTGMLPILGRGAKEQQVHLFEKFPNSLISIPKLCDQDYTAVFTKDSVNIYKQKPTIQQTSILQAPRNKTTGLWELQITQPQQIANYAHKIPTIRDKIKFYHQTCGNPVKSTWLEAIANQHFVTWPGLTVENVKKYHEDSIATDKGHMTHQKKNQRSTKRTHRVYAATITEEEIQEGLIATDLTGRFPTTSLSGNKYILIIFVDDANAILAEPMKNKTEGEYLRVYDKIHHKLTIRGFKPQLQKMDNEASKKLKDRIVTNECKYQLVPPHNHRTNPAERAIQTFKAHFISILCTTDPTFPLYLWDKLLEQAEITINLLRKSNLHPHLSAYAHLFGIYDFNAKPMAPAGTKALIFETTQQRQSWQAHGQDGWYVAPAVEHYRCYKTIKRDNKQEITTDTIKLYPAYCKMPTMSTAELAINAAQQLTDALSNPSPATPYQVGNEEIQQLKQLSEIFTKSLPKENNAPKDKVHDDQLQRVPKAMKQKPKTHKNEQLPIPSIPQKQICPVNHKYPTRSKFKNTGNENQPKAYAVFDETTKKLLEYKQLITHPKYKKTWTKSAANEFGRLAQGIRDIKGTDTIFFITKNQVPKHKKVSYARFVCELRPLKQEQERTRITVGGDRLDYNGPTTTETADITTSKILFNSTISTPGAKFMGIDIKNFYLGTPMKEYEYIKIHLSKIPDEIIEKYELKSKADEEGFVYIEIRRGMYGLKQSGRIANEQLQAKLAKHGYYPTTTTSGLWKHKNRPIQFALVVDDFGVKYVGKEHAQHLIQALKETYQITIDWEGSVFCGMHLKWDYDKRTVEVNMPGYVKKHLDELKHPIPNRPQHAPSKYVQPEYGTKIQLAKERQHTLTPEQQKQIQKVCGMFLYYARAVDPTMLHALNELAVEVNQGDDATIKAMTHFLDYCYTHPDATIRYKASDMILWVHSDAGYNNTTGAKSRAGGHFYLGNHPNKKHNHNGNILAIAKVIKNVMASATEAELGAMYINAREAIACRHTLQELGHQQPPTPIITDNLAAQGIINKTMKQRRSKAMDMRFHWLQDRAQQKQIQIQWAPSKTNYADFYTKHHSAKHHKNMRRTYIHEKSNVLERVC